MHEPTFVEDDAREASVPGSLVGGVPQVPIRDDSCRFAIGVHAADTTRVTVRYRRLEHDPTVLDGDTPTVRSDGVDNPQRVGDIAEDREKAVSESVNWNDSDVDNQVIDDSPGEVVVE